MSEINSAVQSHIAWTNKFKELCYQVFYVDQKGSELLKHLELKILKKPVATPGHDSSWAYFYEGQNDIIRSFSSAIEQYMNEPDKTATVKKTKRGLK